MKVNRKFSKKIHRKAESRNLSISLYALPDY